MPEDKYKYVKEKIRDIRDISITHTPSECEECVYKSLCGEWGLKVFEQEEEQKEENGKRQAKIEEFP
jgi:hypothetical protein